MKKCIAAVCAIVLAISMNGLFAADEPDNLVRNPDFETNAEGKAKPWTFRHARPENAFVKNLDRDGNIAKMEIASNQPQPGRKLVFKYGNVFSQSVIRPPQGRYVYSVKISASRKFGQILIVLYGTGPDKKRIYKSSSVKPSDPQEPGKWRMLIGEIDIPEGLKTLGFAVEIRDKKPGGHILIGSPKLVLKEE